MKLVFSVYLTYYLFVAGYVLVFYLLVRSLMFVAKHKYDKEILQDFSSSYFLMLAFSYIGMTLGLLTGLSINPVVHAVIPALLTFLTGLTAYLFIGKEFNKTNQQIAITSLIFISLFLVYGLEVGSKIRVKSELEVKMADHQLQKDLEKYKYDLLRYEKELDLEYRKLLRKQGLDTLK